MGIAAEELLIADTINMVEKVKVFLITEGTHWGINILAALAIFVLGKWVASRATRLIEKAMVKAKIDATLSSFVRNVVYGLLLAFVVIAALSKLGVETTSLAAIFAAAGLAIGLSMQSSLSNLAAGIMIIIFRPFKVGDFIEAAGTMGAVEEVSIFTTKLKNPTNLEVIVPNGSIISGNIINYTSKGTRRLDLVIGVSYSNDLQKVKAILQDIIANEPRILAEPDPVIAVGELGNSSIDFFVRPWVNAADFWNVRFDLLERIKNRFDEEDVTIPFPQRQLHIYNHDAASKKIKQHNIEY